jgi:hypothetical protein
MNILYKTGSAGIITVGTYTTSTDPTYENYYATSDITVGVVTATNGFISVGNTTPITITLSGNKLSFSAVGIGSTTLTLNP